MLAVLRKEKIKSILYNEKIVSVAALAEQFGVTDETVRRDLSELEKEGFLIRKHGGAVLSHQVMSAPNTHDLKNVFVENKQTIAQIAKTHIKRRDCLFLDASTTAYYISKEIADMELTLLTNSLSIMELLAPQKNITLIATGGVIQNGRDSFGSHCAINFLKNFHVDKAFLSCRSLSMSNGITEASEATAEIKKTILNQTDRVFLAADHSKFNKTSFIKICDFDSIHDLITDKALSPEWLSFLEKQNVQIWTPDNMVHPK